MCQIKHHSTHTLLLRRECTCNITIHHNQHRIRQIRLSPLEVFTFTNILNDLFLQYISTSHRALVLRAVSKRLTKYCDSHSTVADSRHYLLHHKLRFCAIFTPARWNYTSHAAHSHGRRELDLNGPLQWPFWPCVTYNVTHPTSRKCLPVMSVLDGVIGHTTA